MSDSLKLGVQDVPVSMIRESKQQLRGAQRDSEEYQELVDSIKNHGVMNPIVLNRGEEGEEEFFVLIDGVQRFSAALDAGLETIPANVLADVNEADRMRKQIVGNIHRIETKPVEYSKQLQKILALDPTLTANQLATDLNKSSAWIQQRLGLLKLDPKIASLVDEGKINLSNAYALAKLPPEEQVNHVDSAMTETPGEFVAKMHERKKELDKARREGRKAEEGFTPIARFQKMADAKREIDDPTVAPILIRQESVTNPVEAFTLGVKWCLKLDPASVADAKRQWEDKKKAQEERREKAKAERMDKRAKDAEVRADRIKLEAELIKDGKSEDVIKEALNEFDKRHGLTKKEKTEEN